MINSIQHIGIGVEDRESSFEFYGKGMGFSVPISNHTGNCSGVLPIIEKDETRKVIIALNPYGGGLLEIFQYTSKKPKPPPKEIDLTYNGYLFYGLAVKNINKALEKVKQHNGIVICSHDYFTPLQNHNWKTAVFKDRDGIIVTMLEYPGSRVGHGSGRSKIGGVEYVAIGVSNLKQSLEFYTRILGYDEVVYVYEGTAPEWENLFGKGRKIKRALLRRSAKPHGMFRYFLHGGMIELMEVEGNIGKHNFEGRKWGDIGFMELCFDVNNIDDVLEKVTRKGAEIAVPPYKQDLGLNTMATFSYIKDPDGSLIEFADVQSLPVPYFFIRTMVNPFTVNIARKLKILK